MIATTTATTALSPSKKGMGIANMHANTAGAPLPLIPRRASSSSSIASTSSAASIASISASTSSGNIHEVDDGSSSSSSSSSTPRKVKRVRGMRGVPPPELAASSSSSGTHQEEKDAPSQVPFPASVSAPVSLAAAPTAASPIQKSQPLLYTPGMSLMSLRLASLPKPQSPPKHQRPGPLPLSPPSSSCSGAQYTGVLTYAPASYSKPSFSSAVPQSHTHTHTHHHPHTPHRSLSSPPSATPIPKTPTTPLTPSGTPEVRKKSGQLVKSSLKSSRSYSSSSSISSSISMSADGTPLPASSSGLSVCTNGSYASSRSEPTTPTASKAVHFDNARLEFVRLFLAEQKPLAVSRDGSPTPDDYDSSGVSGGETREGRENGEWPGFIFGSGKEKEREGEGGEEHTRLAMNVTLAPLPGLLTDPRLVALESMRLVQSAPSEKETAVVHGSVRVRNLAYSKAVWARFTLDGWRTTSEVCARWVESIGGAMNDVVSVGSVVDDLGAAIAAEEEERRRRRGADWDRFAFTIDLSGVALGDLSSGKERRLELAVKYVVEAREQEAMWDNNGGRNYVATFSHERVPGSSSSGPSAAAMAKSVAAANQAYYAHQASLHQQSQSQQQHPPQRRQVRRFRVQEHAVEDESASSEESTETEARAVSRRGRMMPVRAASAPASAGVQSSSSSSGSKSKGRGMGAGVSIRATEEERDMADLKSKLEKVAAQGEGGPSGKILHHHHHASPRASPQRAGGGSSSSSQSSTPTTFTYTAMHHTHSMSVPSGRSRKRSESPVEYPSARQNQLSPSPMPRASAIHQRTQSFPQSAWRGQQPAYQQQTSIYSTAAASDGSYVYPNSSSSFSRSPQQHLGSPRDLWDGDDSSFNRHGSEKGYFDILPLSSQSVLSRANVNANAITLTITGSTPPRMDSSPAAQSSSSPSSSPALPASSYPPSSSTRGVGLGMSLLSPDSALSTPGMVSPTSTSSSSSGSSSEDDEDDEIDVALAGHLAAAAHQLALEEGVIPVPMMSKSAGAAAAAVGMDVAMSAETPYRQFLNKFCFFTGPGSGATSPLNAAVSLVPVSLHHSQASGSSHGQSQPHNAHAVAYQALPGASPPRQPTQGRPTPSSSVETVVGLNAAPRA